MWATYGLVITGFIFMRFLLAWLYRPRHAVTGYRPTVAIIVPAYNEPDIAKTLVACLTVDYPKELIRVVVVDDKSTDETLWRINAVAEEYPELTVIPAPVNQGKRHAMATGIAAADDVEVYVFIDSDSQVTPDAVKTIVEYFGDPKVGAVAGHTDVANIGRNVLTRMQAMQYYIAFRIYKSAEALFGSVMCCSGCFSAYRRDAVAPVLDDWLDQTFLGQPSTFGDDRSLTNFVLHRWRVLYAPDAQAYTNVPEHLKQFLRQQLRWKKSWLREIPRAARAVVHKNPIMVMMFSLSIDPAAAGPAGGAAGDVRAAALHRRAAVLVLRRGGRDRADLRDVLPDEQASQTLVSRHLLHPVLHHHPGAADAVCDGHYPRLQVGDTMMGRNTARNVGRQSIRRS